MATTLPIDWARVVRQAVIAGAAGGILSQLYIYLTAIVPAHRSLLGSWQWVASAALGKAAFTDPVFSWVGLAVYFIVSVGWAGGYAYFAQRQPFVNQRWLVSGLVYGIVVYVFMAVLQIGAGVFVAPPPAGIANALVAHMLFFGAPVAYVVALLDRRVGS